MRLPATDRHTKEDLQEDPQIRCLPVAIIEATFAFNKLNFRVLSVGPLASFADSPETLEGWLNAVNIHIGPVAACKEQLHKAYLCGEGKDVDFCVEDFEGSLHWLNLKSTRQPNASLLCIISDITQLKTAQHSTWPKGKQFRSLLQQAGLNLWEYDYEKHRLHLMCMEDASFRHSVHPHHGGDIIIEDFPTKADLSFVNTAHNAKRLHQAWRELHAKQPIRPIQCRFEHRDKRPIWVEIGCETIFDESGNPLRDLGYFRDITTEKEREQEQRAYRLRLQKMEGNTLYNLCVNLSNDSISLNPSCITWLDDTGNKVGQSFSHYLEKICNKLILPAFRSQVLCCLSPKRLLEAFEAGETSGFLDYQRLFRGTPRWCQLEYHLARWEDTGEIYCYLFISDVDARKQREQQLRQWAEIDEQSGVFNRQAGLERIRAALAEDVRSGLSGGFIMCDLDDFKRINDTFGHAAGDAVITQVGCLLLRIFSGPDIVCRMGGDEFIAYCPGASREAMEEKARRLLNGIKEIRICRSASPLSLSAGLAMVPEQGTDFDILYPRADAMLYAAKKQGKGTYCFT